MYRGLLMLALTAMPLPAAPTNSVTAKSPSLKVQVQNAEGMPIPHVAVDCVDLDTNCVIRGTSLDGGGQRFQTGDNGWFSFTRTTRPQALVIAIDYGFGLAQSSDMTNRPLLIVRPWAWLDGTRTDHGRPIANQRVAVRIVDRDVDPILLNMVELENETVTDSRGHFQFSHVPPGDVFLDDMQPWLGASTTRKTVPARLDEMQVLPGITNHIDLATEGRTVTGHLELGSDLAKTFDFRSLDKSLVLAVDVDGFDPRDRPRIPPEFDTAEKRGPWLRAWYRTTAGRKRKFGFINMRQGMLHGDGSFIAQMVAPGNYVMGGNTIEVREAMVEPLRFVVPPGANATIALEPIDIGNVHLIAPVTLKVGETAPDFEVPLLAGGTIKLSDFRGRYVLLDFWATWCGPCVRETPNLRATYQAWGKDSRFQMISLSSDSAPEAPLKFVKEKNIDWPQAFLGGDWWRDGVSRNYGVTGIPQIMLIGPDGKIVARDLRGEKIKKTVAAVLVN
jgi:peroxiredoxin